MLLFLIFIWFIASTAMRVGKVSLRLVDATSVLHSEQENHLSFFTTQKWLQHKTQVRDPTRAEPWAELWNLIGIRDRGFLWGVCTCDSGQESVPPHVSTAQLEREEELAVPVPGAVPLFRSRAGPPSRCPQVSLLQVVLPCSVTGVNYWHQCDLISNQERSEISEIPISTTEKGWFATVAWWKSGILGFPFWVQGDLWHGGRRNLSWAFSSQQWITHTLWQAPGSWALPASS